MEFACGTDVAGLDPAQSYSWEGFFPVDLLMKTKLLGAVLCPKPYRVLWGAEIWLSPVLAAASINDDELVDLSMDPEFSAECLNLLWLQCPRSQF